MGTQALEIKQLPNLIQLIKGPVQTPVQQFQYVETGLGLDVKFSKHYFTRRDWKGLSPDLIHFHYGAHAAPIALLGVKCPALVTWHGYDANEIPQERGTEVYRDLFANNFIHTVGSEFMRDRLVALGATREQIHKIPMGVNIEHFSPSHDSFLTLPSSYPVRRSWMK